MTKTRVRFPALIIAASFALNSTASADPSDQSQGVQIKSQALEHQLLDIHNAERAAVGSPALRWDPQLAQNATNYAAIIAQKGQLVSAPREGLGVERESLLRAPISYSPQQMMAVWTSERRYFVSGLFPNVSSSGNWADVGSYSQMIWPTTTSVGCGYAPGGGFNWLVCRYSPGGNKGGKPVGTPTYQPESGHRALR